MKEIFSFLVDIVKQRVALVALVKRDFGKRYLSSFVGLAWAFIQPAIYIFVVWFAFTFGLRVKQTASGQDFVSWFITGIVPWMFISQTLIFSSNALEEYSFLIKKTRISPSLIPLVKIFSGMIVHLSLIFIIIILFISFYGMTPSIYWFQIIYYLFALTVLLSGISWLISSINIFIHDMTHIVNIFVSILFWATPIMWPYSMLNGKLRYIALLNPFFYITEGYRYTFIDHVWFFEYVEMNIYFWTFTLLIFVLGILVFNRLRPSFADVL
jgi:ABC-type polysaccharide/polyol phosphate export permease